MTGKTHLGIGVMSTVILSQYMPVSLSIAALGACAFASLLPDVDHPKAFINQYVLPIKNKLLKVIIYVTTGTFIIVLNYFYLNYTFLDAAGTFIILVGISTHRNGITHSLTGFLCFVGIFGYAAGRYGLQYCIIPFGVGYGAHLLGDMFTNRGIPLFYPFKKRRYKMPLTFSVGSWTGKLTEGLITAAGLIYLVCRLPIILSKLK